MMQSQKIGIITTIALLLVISTVPTLTPQSVSAYEKNQATSQTSACGNEFIPINIGCQNTGSQILGDENAVALTAQQTFPEVKLVQKEPPKTPPEEICGDGIDNDGDGLIDEDCPPPEPQTCVECFTTFLSETEIKQFLEILAPGTGTGLDDVCSTIELAPGNLNTVATTLEFMGIDEETIQQIVDCVERVLGLQTEEPLES
jgi:hypothetical protein